MLLTDTVGFVRKLPHQLVEAFKSTLDVVAEADLLVHVVDALGRRPRGPDRRRAGRARGDRRRPSCPSWWSSTRSTVDPTPPAAARRAATPARSIVVSARTGEGLDDLLAGPRRPAAPARPRSSSCSSPTTAATSLAAVHREGEVLVERHDADGVARAGPSRAGRPSATFAEFVVRDDGDDAGPGAGIDDAVGSGQPA